MSFLTKSMSNSKGNDKKRPRGSRSSLGEDDSRNPREANEHPRQDRKWLYKNKQRNGSPSDVKRERT